MPVSCSLQLTTESSMLYLMLGPIDQDISDDPVKELRKAQGPLLDDLQSLRDLVTEIETVSQPLVKAKLIWHRKGKPRGSLQSLLQFLELKPDFDLPLNLHLALRPTPALALGQTLQSRLQEIACGQDNDTHHCRVL